MATKILFLTVVLLSVMAECAFANKRLCEELDMGWHFYCDNKDEQQEASSESTPSIEQAKQELQVIKKKLEDLKVRAVMYPTKQNVKDYIAFQQEQLERASAFSHTWQRVIWESPELDYSVKNPISTVGNELRQEIKVVKVKETMQLLKERYGLFFFYSSSCSFCHKYSPILKVFADTYDIEVMAISIDGGILSEWPNTLFNKGQFEKFGLSRKGVPATVLFDNQTKSLMPVGFGLLTVSELEERIYTLIGAKQ